MSAPHFYTFLCHVSSEKTQITQIAQISARGRIREIRVIRGFFQRGQYIPKQSQRACGTKPTLHDIDKGKKKWGCLIDKPS